MPSEDVVGLVRVGILALPMAGLLKLVGQFGIFDVVGPGIGDGEAARAVTTTGYFAGQFVGSVLATTFGIFGVIALFAYLTNTSAGRWVSVAMISSVLGLALILSSLGVLAYALPAVGRAYLSGQEDAFRIADAFFSGPLIAIFFLSLFYAVGSVLFGVEIWRSGTLPKWAGVLYAASGLFISFPLPIDTFRVVGAVLLILGGGWISLSILRQPPGGPPPIYNSHSRR